MLFRCVDDHAGRPAAAETLGSPACLRFGFAGGLAAELHKQPAAAPRQRFDRAAVQALSPAGFHQSIVESLEPDRPQRHDLGRAICRLEDVGEAGYQKGSMRRAGDKPDGRL